MTVCEDNQIMTLNKMREKLDVLLPGMIEDDSLLDLLAEAWDDFDGSGDTSMAAYKVRRGEKLKWESPNLIFQVERHGGAVMGSSRATIQEWTVNIKEGTASCQDVGHRQLAPMQSRIDLRAIIEELAALITSQSKEKRLKWLSPGKVRVSISEVIPMKGPKQTVESRRKRLRVQLTETLAAVGWSNTTGWTFDRQSG